MLRVLIVDDSSVFRSQIRAALTGVDGVEVVGFASNGRLALEVLKTKEVDIVTLDLEMPEMDGLTTLAEMKRLGLKAKVIVFSAQSVAGAEATLKALQSGARDFVAKPILSGADKDPAQAIRRDLLPKIQQFMPLAPSSPATLIHPNAGGKKINPVNWRLFLPRVLVIASSTGGPEALGKLFNMLRPPFNVPILITQHMPPVFTASLAERLGRFCDATVAEGQDGEAVVAGRVYVAPGNYHMRLVDDAGTLRIRLDQQEQRNFVRPAADFLFESAAQFFQNSCMGVVLTGMGSDGLDGARAVKNKGGAIMIQNRETCTVFGMPGAVFAEGIYDAMGDLSAIAEKLLEMKVCSSLNRDAQKASA